MLCPFTVTRTLGHQYPCGKCGACLCNRRRKVVGRLLLESRMWAHSAFVTLTYADEHVPLQLAVDAAPLLVLNPRDPTLMLKRLRKRIGSFRYFLAGEYGTKTARPHYHAIIFGWPGTWLYDRQAGPLHDSWKLGFVQTYDLDKGLAMYASSYVTKKHTKHLEDGRPDMRARWSRDPAIGAGMAEPIARSWMKTGADWVPFEFIQHGRRWPLDRLMRKAIGDIIGIEPKPRSALDVTEDQLDEAYQALAYYEAKEARSASAASRI